MNKSWRVVGLCGGDDEQPHPSPRRIAWTAGTWCKASSRATQGAQLLVSSERSEGSRISGDEAQLPPLCARLARLYRCTMLFTEC